MNSAAESPRWLSVSRPGVLLFAAIALLTIACRARPQDMSTDFEEWLVAALIGEVATLSMLVMLSTTSALVRCALFAIVPIQFLIVFRFDRNAAFWALALVIVSTTALAAVWRALGFRISAQRVVADAEVRTGPRQITLAQMMLGITWLASLLGVTRLVLPHLTLLRSFIVINLSLTSFVGIWAVFGQGEIASRIAALGSTFVSPFTLDLFFGPHSPDMFWSAFIIWQMGSIVAIVAPLGLARMLGFRGYWINGHRSGAA